MRCSVVTTADRGSDLTTWAWSGDRERPAKSEDRVRTCGLDTDHVAYCLTLLACGILFGLFVGGYAGYMDAATPAADSPWSLAQVATSDVQWTAMMRQYGVTHGFTSPAHDTRESHWQRWAGHAAMHNGSGISSGASPSVGRSADSVHRAAIIRDDMQKMVLTP
jgi:hypothetical protein